MFFSPKYRISRLFPNAAGCPSRCWHCEKFGGEREISAGLKSSASGGFHFKSIEEANRITLKSPLWKAINKWEVCVIDFLLIE
jgi:hypothetical protein